MAPITRAGLTRAVIVRRRGTLLPCPPRQRISSGSPFEPTIGFSRALRVGDRVLVSGTAPVFPDGSCPDDVAVQARRCFAIIEAALAEAGAAPGDVVRTRDVPRRPRRRRRGRRRARRVLRRHPARRHDGRRSPRCSTRAGRSRSRPRPSSRRPAHARAGRRPRRRRRRARSTPTSAASCRCWPATAAGSTAACARPTAAPRSTCCRSPTAPGYDAYLADPDRAAAGRLLDGLDVQRRLLRGGRRRLSARRTHAPAAPGPRRCRSPSAAPPQPGAERGRGRAVLRPAPRGRRPARRRRCRRDRPPRPPGPVAAAEPPGRRTRAHRTAPRGRRPGLRDAAGAGPPIASQSARKASPAASSGSSAIPKRASAATRASSSAPRSVSRYTRARPSGPGSWATRPAASSRRSRSASRFVATPGSPCTSSPYRRGPASSSRTTSSVQRSPTASRAAATAQNCW